MLKAPNTDLPYKPTVDSLLSGLETEYKDNEFKRELLKLDPNNKKDRSLIIKNYVLRDQEYLSYRHKYLLISKLESALSDKDYDFTSPFEYDYETDEPSASPWSADEIQSPRGFFEEILTAAKNTWKDDLLKAGTEDQSTW